MSDAACPSDDRGRPGLAYSRCDGDHRARCPCLDGACAAVATIGTWRLSSRTVNAMFVTLSRRSNSLVNQQLAQIERLEQAFDPVT